MRLHDAAPRPGVAFLFGLLALGGTPVAAQSARLAGVVTDSAGAPVAQADVAIVAARQLVRTDDHGRFELRRLSPGDHVLTVRRLGFHPVSATVTARDDQLDSVHVVLAPHPAELDAVEVSATERRRREGIEGFHRRRVNGLGTYITREEIVARNSFSTSDILRNVPGVRFVRVPSGRGLRFSATTSIGRANCMPMIWIDGQRAPGMEVDDLPLTDLEGIELYSGPATTPLQFSQSSSSNTCGAVVIWSRPPPLAGARP